jgi:ribosomal protein S18 acetylase RimI-like enzyme
MVARGIGGADLKIRDEAGMTNVVIRQVEPDDLDQVADIVTDGRRVSGMPMMKVGGTAQARIQIESALKSDLAGYVATVGRDVVGFLGLIRPTSYLAYLYIAADFRGAGIGKELLSYSKTELPAGFWTQSAITNVRACHFWEREGLVRGKTSVHPVLNHEFVEYRWSPSN